MARETDLMNLLKRIEFLENRLKFQERLETGASALEFVPLTSVLTSTNWDGDAKNESSTTTLNVNTVFGVPSGAEAVLMYIRLTGTVNRLLRFFDDDGELIWIDRVTETYNDSTVVIPLSSNCINYNTAGGEVNVEIKILGYWI